jgi:hypothetical protein
MIKKAINREAFLTGTRKAVSESKTGKREFL